MNASRTKRWGVLFATSVLVSGCLIDWDSLREDGGVVDASDEHKQPFDAPLDVPRDTPRDVIEDGGGETGAPDASDASDTSVGDAACAHVFTGTLATFDFTGQAGSQASTAPASMTAGLTVGSISRAPALTAAAGANSINASNWSTSSTLDTTRYYTITLTPPATCALDVTSITIDDKASGTGPVNGALASSADTFASTTTFATGSVSMITATVMGATSAVELRIYGYGATASAGTFRLQNTLTITGKLK